MINIDFTTKPKEIKHEYVVDAWGDKRTFNEIGQTHSYNDMPALITHSGHKSWWQYGELHRDNGLPAVIWNSGREEYWINGIKIK